MYTYVYAYVYIYIYTHVYTYTHNHVYIYILEREIICTHIVCPCVYNIYIYIYRHWRNLPPLRSQTSFVC